MKDKKKINLDDLELPVDAYFGTLERQKKDYSLTRLRVKGYRDLLFKLESLLNICILALDNSNSGNHQDILEPDEHIKAVLEVAAQLIPFEEAEFLDTVREQMK
ncbi:hypothetical protein [Flagellimonas myxillae]|uniref:hypothetical protein n=1 Tax=Flagellimonas myxillae TaxID=2942214 RepID=UPI00201F1E94|nr:hypothetical protein [Muricauda myxillae]MCL6265084.1 hypothetical protein [Muricauda myxillae]